MKKPFLLFFSFLFLFFLFFVSSSKASAVALQISSASTVLNEEEEFDVLINLEGSSSIANKNYFLEGVFTKKDSSPSYFGWTKNDRGSWQNHDSHFADFYKITTSSEASWSGSLRLKPDLSDSSFKGSGEYYLKVFRYTESGTKNDEGNQLLITINHQEPSPSPSPSSEPSSESDDSSSSSSPSPSPSAVLVVSVSPSPSPVAKKKVVKEEKEENIEEEKFIGEVFGVEDKQEENKEEENQEEKKEGFKFSLPLVFILSGFCFLSAASFPFLKPKLMALKEKLGKRKERKRKIVVHNY